ncbi:MAG: Holliday junction resolvase RuvX [Candidatus Kapaibacteriales bacterium]
MRTTAEILKGKRIAGIDFGLKRVGISICDELHISITPLKVLDYSDPSFWEKLLILLDSENVKGIVVGVPLTNLSSKRNILPMVQNFILELKQRISLLVFEVDESFSSKNATSIMLEIGKKKSQRRRKGYKDLVASAIILRDFINENNL